MSITNSVSTLEIAERSVDGKSSKKCDDTQHFQEGKEIGPRRMDKNQHREYARPKTWKAGDRPLVGNTTKSQLNPGYNDWYQVYKSEVTDRIKHWPSNRRMEMDINGNANEVMEVVAI